MQAILHSSQKLPSLVGVVLGGLILLLLMTVVSPGHAAAASISDCNKVKDTAGCKAAFNQCSDNSTDNQTTKQCQSNVILSWQSVQGAGNTLPQNANKPSKDTCNQTSKAADCKKDFDNCGNKSDTKTTDCQKSVVNQYLKKDLVNPNNVGTFQTGDNQYKTINDVCGGTVDGEDLSVGLSIKIGCKGQGNPIADATFAIIRILSDLVGLVIVGSIVYGGLQYIGSRGDPQSTAMAVNRIRSSLFALLLFIFGYAILNFLIPAGFLG